LGPSVAPPDDTAIGSDVFAALALVSSRQTTLQTVTVGRMIYAIRGDSRPKYFGAWPFPSLFPSLHVEVDPLNTARGSGGAL